MLYCSKNLGSRSICTVLLLAAVLGLDIAATLGWAFSLSSNNLSTSAVVFQKSRHTHTLLRNRVGPSLSLSMSSTNTGAAAAAATGTATATSTTFKVLGVCGGIGSGKSTACKLLVDSRKCNCLAHIDADKVAHSVYAPGSQAVKDVVAKFGAGILVEHGNDDDNENETTNDTETKPMEIDRKKLGAIVFAERSAMAQLEGIVWPHVRDRLVEQIQELRDSWEAKSNSNSNSNSNSSSESTNSNSDTMSTSTVPVVVLEAAILLDAGWDDLLDAVWVVTAPREQALARLVETRGLSSEEASKRIDAQESRRGIGTLEDEVETGIVHCVIANDGSLGDLEGALGESLDSPGCWKPYSE